MRQLTVGASVSLRTPSANGEGAQAVPNPMAMPHSPSRMVRRSTSSPAEVHGFGDCCQLREHFPQAELLGHRRRNPFSCLPSGPLAEAASVRYGSADPGDKAESLPPMGNLI